VFVYKLITRGTVEERILKMQKAKQKLSDTLYNNTAADIRSAIDHDWMELLKPLGEEFQAK
jgi:SNF2 family DNA or RNA helicase